MAISAGRSQGAAAGAAKEIIFVWEGKDKSGKVVKGELRAGSETIVSVTLRKQGVLVTKVRAVVMLRFRISVVNAWV